MLHAALPHGVTGFGLCSASHLKNCLEELSKFRDHVKNGVLDSVMFGASVAITA